MGVTNFPNGVSSQGAAVNGGGLPPTFGKYVYVDSNNGSDGNNGLTSDEPKATVDGAVNVCSANKGDVIIVLPNHAETLSSATALNLDIAGIIIYGLGYGLQRPIFTLDTADTTTIPVSAADIAIYNCDYSANFADIAACFTLTTAKNFQTYNCEFVATAANMNFLAIVETNTTDNAADGLTMVDFSWIEPDTATTSMINVDGDLDSMKLVGGYFNLGVNTSDLPILVEVATGKDTSNIYIDNCCGVRLNDANPLLITNDTTTANTGVIKNCKVLHADTGTEELITSGTNILMSENYCTAVIDKSGFVLPAADS